ncbi:MAG: efflux RND transporter periplasmic adaptor subunit [Myxococcota bacterium]
MARSSRNTLKGAAAPWVLSALGALAVGCTAQAQSPEPPTRDEVRAELPAIRVQVADAEQRSLTIDASASGTLHAFKSATVAAEVAGRVTQRAVERGASVQAKGGLFKIDTRNSQLSLRQAKASEAASAIDLDLAQRELERGKSLLSGQDISRSSFDQLAASRDSARKRMEQAEITRRQAAKSISDARVRAPFDATVVRLHAEVGDYVAPGTPLATVADLSRLRLRVGLTAVEADALEAADRDTVRVTFAALGGTEVDATLHDIDPLIDPVSGTYTAEFWLEQPEGAPLREGMVGQLDLATATDEPELVIPRTSVVRHGAGFAVWVVERGGEHRGTATRKAVTLGRHDATHTIVLTGLSDGDTVVTDGHFALAEGAAVELDEVGA